MLKFLIKKRKVKAGGLKTADQRTKPSPRFQSSRLKSDKLQSDAFKPKKPSRRRASSKSEETVSDALDTQLGVQKGMLTTVLWWLGAMLLVYFQYLYWYGSGGVFEQRKINDHIATQETKLAELRERNRQLKAEVDDLKHGNAAVEEHARLDLGLIKPGETFFQINTVQTK